MYWVHNLPCRNTADIDFEDDSSLSSESKDENEDWLLEREFWVSLLSTSSGHFKVYLKGYIYMHN